MRPAGCRTALGLFLLTTMLAGVTGCRHKATVAVVPIPPPKQLPVDTTAKVEPPQPVVEKVPLQPTPLPTVTVPTKKKARKARKAATPVTPAPGASAPVAVGVQVASAGTAPEANAIGSLTPGGSDGPQLRRQAAELIAMLDKRLRGLSGEVKEKQKDAIVRVMNFRRQAQTALDSGDPEGAVTLATKAKLLLDDLMK